MSQKHPVIAVTGSSGAGTSTVKNSFEHIFRREKLNVAIVEGDSFHRYDRESMKAAVAESAKNNGRPISHFGPEANEFEKLEALFKEYGETGSGMTRLYLHNDEEAAPYNQKPGTFTPWKAIASGTDLLFYEGLHGGAKSDTADVAKYVDLLVGVVPIVNLEWIQKIHRDMNARGYSAEAVTQTILHRMHDYVHYITPQFSRTHINFQRVPMVDTSNPFIAREIPTLDESMVVIRFRDYKDVDFPFLLNMLHDSFMSRPNTLVVPGGKMGMAIELILTPLIIDLAKKSKH
ncbi:MAG: phosphoribulokinase [Nitrosomonas sp.]|nr:MAG: phosphoribulokinase [Nitrosomonas sp.]HMV11964.1 phosphoribulokinase [Nitrosomonas sp.]HMW19491.1 phosphoribulokinase [Nitrosomonas sp.]HMW68759.1 phosphoribulokinase [Nitrosomonas sp.]HMY61473.1 phosphoribulokinase [Nitrosomonas sp.]